MFGNQFPTQSPGAPGMPPMAMARQREMAPNLRFQDPSGHMVDPVQQGNRMPFNNSPMMRQSLPHTGTPPSLPAPGQMPPTIMGPQGIPVGHGPIPGNHSLELQRIERERQERERERQVDLQRREQLKRELELERAKIRRKREEEERQRKIQEDLKREQTEERLRELERQREEERARERERDLERQREKEQEKQRLQREREKKEEEIKQRQLKIQQRKEELQAEIQRNQELKQQRQREANEKRRREEMAVQQQQEGIQRQRRVNEQRHREEMERHQQPEGIQRQREVNGQRRREEIAMRHQQEGIHRQRDANEQRRQEEMERQRQQEGIQRQHEVNKQRRWDEMAMRHQQEEIQRNQELVMHRQREANEKRRREEMERQRQQELEELELQRVREIEILREREAAIEHQMALNRERQYMIAADILPPPGLQSPPSAMQSGNPMRRPEDNIDASLMEKVRLQQALLAQQTPGHAQGPQAAKNRSGRNRGRKRNRNKQSTGGANATRGKSSSESKPQKGSDQSPQRTGSGRQAQGQKQPQDQNRSDQKRRKQENGNQQSLGSAKSASCQGNSKSQPQKGSRGKDEAPNRGDQNRGKRENGNQQQPQSSAKPGSGETNSQNQPQKALPSLLDGMDPPPRITGFNEVTDRKRKSIMENRERKKKRMAMSSEEVHATSDFHPVSRMILKMRPTLPPSLEWICFPCDAPCTDVMQYHQHMMGKKHQAHMNHIIDLAAEKSLMLEAHLSENHMARVKRCFESDEMKNKSNHKADLCRVCMLFVFDGMKNHLETDEHKNALKEEYLRCRICDEKIASLHNFLKHCHSEAHKIAAEVHHEKVKAEKAEISKAKSKEKFQQKKAARKIFVTVDEVGFEGKDSKDKDMEEAFKNLPLKDQWKQQKFQRLVKEAEAYKATLEAVADTALTPPPKEDPSLAQDKGDPAKDTPSVIEGSALAQDPVTGAQAPATEIQTSATDGQMTATGDKTSEAVQQMENVPWSLADIDEFDPCKIIGQEYVIPVVGYFCKLCKKFYENEHTAREKHCMSIQHYRRLKGLLKFKKLWKEPGSTIVLPEDDKQEGAKQETDAGDEKETTPKEIDTKKEVAQEEEKQTDSKTEALKDKRKDAEKEKSGDDEVIKIESDDDEVVTIPDDDDEDTKDGEKEKEIADKNDEEVSRKDETEEEEENKNREKEEKKSDEKEEDKGRGEAAAREDAKVTEGTVTPEMKEVQTAERPVNKDTPQEETSIEEKDANIPDGTVTQEAEEAQTAERLASKDPPQEETTVEERDGERTVIEGKIGGVKDDRGKEDAKEQEDKSGRMEEERPMEDGTRPMEEETKGGLEERTPEEAAMDYDREEVPFMPAGVMGEDFEMVIQDEIMDTTEDEEAPMES